MCQPLTIAEEDTKEILIGVLHQERAAFQALSETLLNMQQDRLEASIRFLEALQQIRDENLYRPRTLEEFCQQHCGFGASRARQLGAYLAKLKKLIAVANSVGVTESNALADLPKNEWQSRGNAAPPVQTPAEARNGTENMDAPQILQFVRKAEVAAKAEADVVIGGQVCTKLGKAFEANVRLLGRAYKQAQQRHPSFEEAQDLIAAAARSLCVAADLNVPAWAQEEPGPTGKKQTKRQRGAA